MNKRTVGSSLTDRYFPFRGNIVAQMKFSLTADLAKSTDLPGMSAAGHKGQN